MPSGLGFPYNNSFLSYPKTDPAPLPSNKNPINYLTASEWNAACQALIDLRSSIISGSYHGFTTSSLNPNVQAGLSGTNGWIWQSSSLHPYWSHTSSAGLISRGICLTPTGSYTISGVWRTVWVDSQGVVISGSTIGDGNDGGSSSTASLDFLTRDLTVQRNVYISGSIQSTLLTGTFAAFQEVTASSGINTLRLVSTGLSSLTNVTASAGIKTNLDLEAVRNLTIGGNASFVSITGSGGANFLDLEVSRNSSLANVTASAGIKTNLDLEVTRRISTANITASAGALFSLDAAITRNLAVNGNTNIVSVTASLGRWLSSTGSYFGNTTADTANAHGHVINAESPLNNSSAKLISVKNVGVPMFSIGPSGSSYFGDGSSVLGFYHYYGQDPATAKLILYADNSNGTVLTFPGQPTLQFAFSQATITGKFVQQTGDVSLAGSSNKIGLYGNNPVSRPAAYTLNGGINYRNLPSGSIDAQHEGVLRQLIADLINVGIITGTL